MENTPPPSDETTSLEVQVIGMNNFHLSEFMAKSISKDLPTTTYESYYRNFMDGRVIFPALKGLGGSWLTPFYHRNLPDGYEMLTHYLVMYMDRGLIYFTYFVSRPNGDELFVKTVTYSPIGRAEPLSNEVYQICSFAVAINRWRRQNSIQRFRASRASVYPSPSSEPSSPSDPVEPSPSSDTSEPSPSSEPSSPSNSSEPSPSTDQVAHPSTPASSLKILASSYLTSVVDIKRNVCCAA